MDTATQEPGQADELAAAFGVRQRKPAKTDAGTRSTIGARMAQARSIADMTAADAAQRLGLAEAKLTAFEAGIGGDLGVPLLTLIAATYGVTPDFLCGFTSDTDRDPAAAVMRTFTARVEAASRAIVARVAGDGVDALRNLAPDFDLTQALAEAAIELDASVGRMADLNPAFADMRGGATLSRLAREAAAVGNQWLAHVRREKCKAAHALGFDVAAVMTGATAQATASTGVLPQ